MTAQTAHADVGPDVSGGESARAVDATLAPHGSSDLVELRRAAVGRFSPAGVLMLQRTAGNRAVAAALGARAGGRMIQREEKQAGEAGKRPDLWVGDTGPAVTLLQSRLGIEQTGRFDEATRLAVVKFRKDVFKEADPAGGVGPMTWQKLDERAGAKPAGTPGNRPSLWLGDSGPAVLLVQRILNITQTGVFDERTRLEVVQFRKVVFKEENPAGGVGPETWKKLDQMAASQAKTGLCGGWHPCCPPGQCEMPDSTTAAGGAWEINIAIDLEVASPGDVTALGAEVGHAWLEFSGGGKRWTYGFYNNPADPAGTPDPVQHPKVMGCVVHPDHIHDACVDQRQKHTVSEEGYQKALALAQTMCRVPEKYDLKNFNCTTFAAKVVEVAGGSVPNYRGTVGGVAGKGGVTADNPYALSESLNKDVPTRTLTDADQIHDWLQPHSYDDIGKLPESEKKRLIREVLKGWVRDKDLESVEWVCRGVKDAEEMKRIEHEITPIAKGVKTKRQSERLYAALAIRPKA